jgi:nicotinamidase/pyrazinamidase
MLWFSIVMSADCLLVVDLQNDFLPGGALAVPDGDRTIPVINGLMQRFALVVATQDWHPADHGSFAANHPGRAPGEVIDLAGIQQILWPVHCVQNTPGAEFTSTLDSRAIRHVIRKGTDRSVDSYSTFFDNARRRSTGLEDYLRSQKVENVFICGLAADYCVKYSALDALTLSFSAIVIQDACRGVNLQAGDSQKALEEIEKAGAKIVESHAIL